MMGCPCRLCRHSNASVLWDLINQGRGGKKNAERASGIPKASFFVALKKHKEYLRAISMVSPAAAASGTPLLGHIPTIAPELPPLPTDAKSCDPEDLYCTIFASLAWIGRAASSDHNKISALREARETVSEIVKLRAAKGPQVADPNKDAAELQKSILEKLDAMLPSPPTAASSAPPNLTN